MSSGLVDVGSRGANDEGSEHNLIMMRSLEELHNELIESLKRERIVKSIQVENALRSVKREEFLWKGDSKISAYTDRPISLGNTGQTISAPHMVAIMLEEAELRPSLKVLEIGTGSGYNAALVAHIVSQNRECTDLSPVVTIERNQTLAKFAKENIKRVGLDKFVEVIEGDGSLGYPQGSKEMMYDRIIVTAGSTNVPPLLESQLNINGILLIPVGNLMSQTLVKISKIQDKARVRLTEQRLMPVMFVPLVRQETSQKL